MMPVRICRLSVRLSVTEVHWRKANLGFKLWSYYLVIIFGSNYSYGVWDIINLFSPLGKLAVRAIYFACVNFFFFLYFFLLGAKLSQYIYWTDFHDLSPNGRHLREFSWSGPVFQIPHGTLPWQPILFCTGLVRSEPKYLSLREARLKSDCCWSWSHCWKVSFAFQRCSTSRMRIFEKWTDHQHCARMSDCTLVVLA